MAFRPNWYDESSRRSSLGRAVQDWSGMRWVFTVCAVVYAAQLVAHSFGSNVMEDVFGLRAWTLSGTPQAPALTFNFLFPVQLLTYMVLHSPSDIWHIFWNLLLLWFFGRELEAMMGKAAFLKLLLVGGLVGGLMQWGYGLYTDSTIPTIGASGAVYTAMVLYSCKWPRRIIWLIIPPVPVPVLLLVVFYVLNDLMDFARGSGGNVAQLVHLGGALVGVLWWRKGDVIAQVQMKRSRDKAAGVAKKESSGRREMDRILGKIQISGLSSLDDKERAFLDKRSKALREGR